LRHHATEQYREERARPGGNAVSEGKARRSGWIQSLRGSVREYRVRRVGSKTKIWAMHLIAGVHPLLHTPRHPPREVHLKCLAPPEHGLYRYFGVPRRTYHALLQAESKGRFFTGRICGHYRFEKLRESER
jgi:hypothetical protein